MYNNIGGKIRGLAQIFALLGIIASVIAGVGCMANSRYDGVMFFVGLLVMIIGSLISWVASWCLYGFGELIDTNTQIELHLRNSREGFFKKNIDWEQIKKEQTEKVTCPVCGADQKGSRTVCFECGAMLKQTVRQNNANENVPAWKRVEEAAKQAAERKTQCPNCGKELAGDERFCTGCGAKADN